MDQNSSNGSVTEKRNWRERLGIGAKDMPKIADEFRTERPAPSLDTTSVKAPKPVAKPAPMAPRNVAPKVVAPKVAAPKSAQRPAPDTQQSALAEKLRAQREAAEKLAAQRVTAARERAETRISPEPRLRPTQPEARADVPAGRPKFTFADETAPPAFQPKQTSNGIPPLLPPRPALGGDRPPGFSARGQGYAPPNGGYRQEPPAGFRPIDPATGYPGRPAGVPRSFPPLGGTGAPALPAGRRQAPPVAFDDRYHGEDEEFRGDPRLSRSMARQQPIADDGDDVFDEPAPAHQGRRRASAAEYNAAYREAEEGYAEPGRRSGGPWLLLFALLLAAVATGGIVWYYQTKIKPVAAAGSGTTTEQVPVVAAPVEPVKTAAETPAEQPAVVEPTNKKQIYDRIVGDQEVSGNAILVPSEQTPIQPEAQNGLEGQTGTELIPAPAGTQSTDDAEPLPLPPPPGETGNDTQGSLDGGTQVQPAATGTAAVDANAETIGSLVQKSATDTSAAVESPPADGGGSMAAATEQVPQLEAVGQEPVQEPVVAKPVEVKKPATTAKKVAAKPAKKPAKANPEEGSGTEPVVLVPPSQGGETTVEAIDIGGGSAVAQDGTAGGEVAAPAKKKKTIFDLFKGKNASADDATAPAEAQETQVASNTATEESTAVPSKKAAAAVGGSGYVAQLAWYRSQDDAQAGFSRLQGKYPDALGGKQASISEATVAGSTRYRLGVGPLTSREEAQKICESLLARGERDCLVRKQ